MIIKYFPGLQYHVRAPETLNTHGNFQPLVLKLSKNIARQHMIAGYVTTLTGRIVVTCKTIEECHAIHELIPVSNVIVGKTKDKARTDALFAFHEHNTPIITTVAMWHLLSFYNDVVDHLVNTTYTIYKDNSDINTVLKLGIDVYHHIVDNVSINVLIGRFIKFLKKNRVAVEVDASTLKYFEFDPNKKM